MSFVWLATNIFIPSIKKMMHPLSNFFAEIMCYNASLVSLMTVSQLVHFTKKSIVENYFKFYRHVKNLSFNKYFSFIYIFLISEFYAKIQI